MNDETRQRIEREIADWHRDYSEARKRFEELRAKWDEVLKPLTDAIERCERLTEDDYNIRITL